MSIGAFDWVLGKCAFDMSLNNSSNGNIFQPLSCTIGQAISAAWPSLAHRRDIWCAVPSSRHFGYVSSRDRHHHEWIHRQVGVTLVLVLRNLMIAIRIAASSILVKSLLPLLSALGQSNPVLKGVAYMQVRAR